ncbi:MAG: glycosyltransferase [Flavobacteriaceae bacterium]
MARILLMSIGSRGDMEPFLALGEEALAEGHKIGCCMPVQFEPLVNELTPHFFPQDKALLDLVEGPEIKKIMSQEGNGFSRLLTLFKLWRQIKSVQEQLIQDQEEAVKKFNPDQIIFHIKCIYPVFWALHFKGTVKLLSPIPALLDPIEDIPHVGFGKPRSKTWNKITYRLAEYALIHQSILSYGKTFMKKNKLHLTTAALKQFYRTSLPVEYAVSDLLFIRPSYWPSRAQVSHFRERKKSTVTTLTEDLKAFLNNYPTPLYVGFGSMLNAQPKQIVLDILAVCEKLQIPVVLNESWGGLECPEKLPPWAFKIKNEPFHLLFPHLRAVIHHGGSGTTHSALLHGKPQAIIPHIADQFFWNRQIEKMGVGCSGFKIKQWRRARFEKLVIALLQFKMKS